MNVSRMWWYDNARLAFYTIVILSIFRNAVPDAGPWHFVYFALGLACTGFLGISVVCAIRSVRPLSKSDFSFPKAPLAVWLLFPWFFLAMAGVVYDLVGMLVNDHVYGAHWLTSTEVADNFFGFLGNIAKGLGLH